MTTDTKNVLYPTTQYIWGPDRVLAKLDVLSGNTYYYLYNGHGDVVQIVDTSGDIKNSYDYDVWGNFLKKEETIENHFTYFGQTYDEKTGLYYLRARYYDPTTGRFTQQDPAEDGYNWYVYGNQNPVVYVDWTGYVSKKEASKRIWINSSYINDAAEEFGVNPGILAACIYAEQVLNVDWVDDVTDFPAYMFDTSIGLAQVKVSTAQMLEDNGYIEKTEAIIINGKEIMSRWELIAIKLTEDESSIRYAAAYLSYIRDLWEYEYPEIGGRTAIMATVYNLGHQQTIPNNNPQPNDFGVFAKDNYYYMREILDLK